MSKPIFKMGDVLALKPGARWTVGTQTASEGSVILLLSDVHVGDKPYGGRADSNDVPVVYEGALTETLGNLEYWEQCWSVVCSLCEPETSSVR